VAVGGLVACEPPLVVLDLTVTTAVDGNDVAPGNGACEKTAGVGDCTLRAAITEANATAGYDVITIASGVDPVLSVAGTGDEANATGDLDVAGDVRIVGNGATVDAAGLDRVFDIRSGRARLEDVTVTRGAGPGAGVRAVGHLDLVLATVSGNNPGNAPVIEVSGSAALTQSQVVGNALPSGTASALSVSGAGSLGLHRSLVVVSTTSGAGLRASGTSRVVAVDSTVQAATGTLISAEGSAAVTVARSTLQKTTGAATMVGVAPLAGLTVVGSVLDHTTALAGSALCPARVVSGGWNVASHACGALAATGDVAATPTWLHPLVDNGGFTATMLPYDGSPVLDRIPAGTPLVCDANAVDQRGVARPAGGACDAGAVEGSGGVVQELDLVVDSALDGVDVAPGDGVCATGGGACTLRAAAQEVNAANPELPLVGHTIAIAPGVHPTLSIAGAGEDLGATGDVDLRVPVVIDGGGAVIDGADLDRVLDLHGQTAVLRDLTVTGGEAVGSAPAGVGGGVRAGTTTRAVDVHGVTFHANAADQGGGGLGIVGASDAATVTVTDSVFTGNGAGIGGALYLRQGTITRSLIAGNQAVTSGGGIYGEFGVVTVVSSTLSGNYAPGGGSAIVSHGMFSTGAVLVGSTIVGNTGSAALWTLSTVCTRGCYSYENTEMRGTVVVGGAGAAGCTAPVTTSSFNLVPDGSCGATLPGTPSLGPLADNGGATATHLPGAGSGVIDAIPGGTVGLCDGSVATDQRGVARPVGSACDVGAVEQ
jgi:CSLREA domain-containing protein